MVVVTVVIIIITIVGGISDLNIKNNELFEITQRLQEIIDDSIINNEHLINVYEQRLNNIMETFEKFKEKNLNLNKFNLTPLNLKVVIIIV